MMRTLILLIAILLLVPALAIGDDASQSLERGVMPILKSHCTECHSGPGAEAKLDLSGPWSLDQLLTQREHWFKVLERVESGSMPPEDAAPLKPAEKQALVTWIRGAFTDLMLERQRQEGRSKIRRLSRSEYANTVQDLLGIRPPVVRLMPNDGRVAGYNKVSSALPFSTAMTEAHIKIADDLVSRMFELPVDKVSYRLWAAPSEQSKGHVLELPDDWKVSFNTDTTSGPLRKATDPEGKNRNGFPGPRKPGMHRLRMSVYAYQSEKPIPFGIFVGHVFAYPQILELREVLEAPPGKPTILEADVYLRTGQDSDGPSSDGIRLIPFGLGVQVPKNTQASNCEGPGLAIQWVDVEEIEETLPGQRLLAADFTPEMAQQFRLNANLASSKIPREEIEAAVARSLQRIGSRLYRRDLTEEELSRGIQGFMRAIDEGEKLKAAYVSEVALMMASPDFLCVLEQPGKLDDFALASRLSYFLWNSTPDEELLEIARQGQLSDPKILHDQTERMLLDPKSDRFVEDFLDQWLGLWEIENTTPDKDLYPEYDELLKISSLMETQETFRAMLEQNRSVRDFVAPDWALINGRLAELYGIPGVEGFRLRSVDLPEDTPFGGIWTQAAPMKVTANGTLTSPIKRGVWVAERLLGITIPPPPPNIDPVDPDIRGATTLREQLALHSGEGSCKACHARFDPYGFAMESFDVMGNYRENYRVINPEAKGKWQDGLPVDCSGTLPNGKAFADIRELREQMAQDPAQLARGVVRHLITYGTGEPTTPTDHRTIESIVQSAAKDDFGLRTLLHGVIQSDLFQSK